MTCALCHNFPLRALNKTPTQNFLTHFCRIRKIWCKMITLTGLFKSSSVFIEKREKNPIRFRYFWIRASARLMRLHKKNAEICQELSQFGFEKALWSSRSETTRTRTQRTKNSVDKNHIGEFQKSYPYLSVYFLILCI